MSFVPHSTATDNSRAALVVFSFGTTAAAGNGILGRQASLIALRYNMPVFAQPHIYLDERLKNVGRSPESLKTLWPTLRVARTAIVWAKKQGSVDRPINQLVVLAGPEHQQRAARDLMEANLEAGGIFTIREDAFTEVVGAPPLRSQWFDMNARPLRFRSEKMLALYELALILMPFGMYKRIAS